MGSRHLGDRISLADNEDVPDFADEVFRLPLDSVSADDSVRTPRDARKKSGYLITKKSVAAAFCRNRGARRRLL
jgi:hypothetical protein